jgi:hypothetical protein
MTLDSRIYYATAKIILKDSLRTLIKIASLFMGMSLSSVGFTIILNIGSTMISLLKNLLKILEIRPSIVT